MKSSVLTRYRVMAYVTAVMLLILCACMVAKYGFDTGEDLTFAVSQTHGVLYIIYLFVAFFVERKVTRETLPLVSGAQPAPAKA
jgi:integral membrane protein